MINFFSSKIFVYLTFSILFLLPKSNLLPELSKIIQAKRHAQNTGKLAINGIFEVFIQW